MLELGPAFERASGHRLVSAFDSTGTIAGQWLSERLGQPFIIENRPGGGIEVPPTLLARADEVIE